MATWPNTWCKSGRFIRLLFSRESESCACETSSTVFGKPVRSTQKNASDWVWAKSTKMVERKNMWVFHTTRYTKDLSQGNFKLGGNFLFSKHMQIHALREMLHLFVVEKYSTITPQPFWQFCFWCRWRSTAGSEHRRRAYSHRTGVNS